MKLWPALACAAAVLLGGALFAVIVHMPDPPIRLEGAVRAQLPASGVAHPVTAILLNYRGYDTLLEVAVLLLAAAGMLATGTHAGPASLRSRPLPLLQLAARKLVPPMIVVAGYFVWIGARAPGGAFQAGAVLAAAAVFSCLAGVAPAWAAPRLLLRAGLAGGLLVFLTVAALPSSSGALLHYRHERAAVLILLVESALTLSLGSILAGLFMWLPREGEGKT